MGPDPVVLPIYHALPGLKWHTDGIPFFFTTGATQLLVCPYEHSGYGLIPISAMAAAPGG